MSAGYANGSSSITYTYTGGAIASVGTGGGGTPTAIAASTFSTSPYGFLSSLSGNIIQIRNFANASVSSNPTDGYYAPRRSPQTTPLYCFNQGAGALKIPYNNVFMVPNVGFGFAAAPVAAAADTDGDNLYAIESGGLIAASSISNTPLPGFSLNVGSGLALVVLSTNEN